MARLRLPTYVPFGVHGSWSTKYVCGPPKEAELKAIEALKAAGKNTSLNRVQLSGDVAAEQAVQEGVDMTTIGAVAAVVAGAALISNFF